MSDFLALGEIFAVWIALSIALWGTGRLWIRSRQRSRLDIAARAIDLARKAQPVFDIIRVPVPLENTPADANAYLRAETHALLERLQEQGAYFDHVNTLRVQLQAALAIEDHKGLSDILHLRRDLWAASEIVLVEDPAQFGNTFAEDGAFERFHAEAVRTLYKLPGQTDGDGDVIDLRLSLAVQEAETFANELADAIAAARERNRLPTPGELAAYPLAWIRAVPVFFRGCVTFLRAFFEQASLLSQRIRGSETVTRSTARMRQISEDWPQRLSESFQRASETTRENASALRQHYDFLAAAHDFKGKYQKLIQRAPELSERSKQFITRLELAERSERLRLTSANAAIWTARNAVNGLAHIIAFLRRVHAAMQETVFWSAAEAAFAPAPIRGRRIPAFKSYHRALAVSGLIEPRQALNWKSDPYAAQPIKKMAVKPAKPVQQEKPLKSRRRNTHKPGSSESLKQLAIAADTEKRPAPTSTVKQAPRKAAAKSSAKTSKPAISNEKRRWGLKAFRMRLVPAKPTKAVKKFAEDARPDRQRRKQPQPVIVNAPAPPLPPAPIDNLPDGASAPLPPQALLSEASKSIAAVEPQVLDGVEEALPNQTVSEVAPKTVPEKNTVTHTDDLLPARKAMTERGGKTSPSFLSRLFKRGNGFQTEPPENESVQQDTVFASGPANESFMPPASDNGTYEPSPSLMDKLSSLDTDDEIWGAEAPEGMEETQPADKDGKITNVSKAEDTNDFGPLTQSIMEIQVKAKPAAPQIRAFPWLRQ